MPPYSPGTVANEFLERAVRDGGPSVTPMQLQKLVYIAHGWHLATASRPLIDEPIEAWKYGPVVPSLFHEFKRFGGAEITKLAYEPVEVESDPSAEREFAEIVVDTPFIPDENRHAGELLDWVWKKYGRMSGWELSMLTHAPKSPWSLTMERSAGRSNAKPAAR